MITCTRSIGFDAGHRLLNHESKCANLHGHRYLAEITCACRKLDSVGRVIDFSVIKGEVAAWIEEHWDHTMILHKDDPLIARLNGIPSIWGPKVPFVLDVNPTAENLAEYLFTTATNLLLPFGIHIVKVKLWETPNCWAEYKPDSPSPL